VYVVFRAAWEALEACTPPVQLAAAFQATNIGEDRLTQVNPASNLARRLLLNWGWEIFCLVLRQRRPQIISAGGVLRFGPANPRKIRWGQAGAVNDLV